MKSPVAFFTTVALAAAALAGCGQTGPLYMPRPPAKPAAQTPAPAPAPAASTPTAPTPAPAQ